MTVGITAMPAIGIWIVYEAFIGTPLHVLQEDLFRGIAFALGVAAVIELAYTLFTHGPDEALDPLMLGLSAALLMQLGKVEFFTLHQSGSAILYIIGLGALFWIRKHLAASPDPADIEWSMRSVLPKWPRRQ